MAGWSVRVLGALALLALAHAARPQAQSPASPTPGPQLSPPPAVAPSAPVPAAPSPSPSAPAPPAALTADKIRSRERMALVSLSTVVQAEKSYAAMNQALFDSMMCLMRPGECIPGLTDATPVLDPGYHWLEPRLGYVMRFHPGPGATPEEIRSSGASPSSIKSFAVTLTPEHPGLTGGRAFCGDSSGKMCFTDGSAPPVKDGRCEPCKKLQ